jgi:alpha-L-fucosidase
MYMKSTFNCFISIILLLLSAQPSYSQPKDTVKTIIPPRVTAKLPGGKAKPIPNGPNEANWESIKKNYKVPDWFRDGKFGIFIHWGLYAVPAHKSEWYPKHMYATPEIIKWHKEHFGPQDKFGYKDFIPMFKAEKFDPDQWAELFKKAGARYVVPVAEHHDGFAMYNSDLTRWCAAKMGPKRDLIGDLATAVRKQGLIFGLSNHRIENWDFMYPKEGLKTDLYDTAYADFYGPPQLPRTQPSQAFQEEWLARCQELVDKYQPQLVYFDNGINGRNLDSIKLRFAAYYYNRAAEWGKEVTINTKSTAFLAGSILDFERGHSSYLRPNVWQTDNTVHQRWGYLKDAVYTNVGAIVRELVDNVSKNGNLLLNISPKPDGTIPDEQVKLLLGIGKWLSLNGEAIYGTRPWVIYGEGPSAPAQKATPQEEEKRIKREAVGDIPPPTYNILDYRFTTKGNTLYAIAMSWPGAYANITSLATNKVGKIVSVTMPGFKIKLPFVQDEGGLYVKLPGEPPCEHAYVLKITGLKLK